MPKIYRIYEVAKNELSEPRQNKEQAIGDVDSLCALDHTSGVFEVHEFDADDPTLEPVVVYSRRA
jgi:hypothetical protein